MTFKEIESHWNTSPPKPKELTVSDMIHQNGAALPKTEPGDLRAYLVQRTMARHGFTEEQATAVILAFGGQRLLKDQS